MTSIRPESGRPAADPAAAILPAAGDPACARQIADHLLTSLRTPSAARGPRTPMDSDTDPPDPPFDPLAAELARRHERDARLVDLLARAAGGSASAFEAFYDETIGYAQAVARRMLPPADIDDILSDAFFQAWRELPRFDPQRGSPVTWLLTIVRSRALDLLRHRRSSPVTAADEEAPEAASDLPGPQALLEQAQLGSRLHAALAELSANERWVLGLAYYREMPHAQIAAATGLPLGTVKSLILRAQHKLRERLS